MQKNFKRMIRISDMREKDREKLGAVGIDVSSFNDCYILPGLTDVHVHFREPGFLYKETIETGSMSAAAGGFTDVFSMPNLDPCPDSMEHLQIQLDAIKKDAVINVVPYGTITVAEKGDVLADMDDIAPYVIAFSDDGRGVASDEKMKEGMQKAAELGKLIVAHCEDESYPRESAEAEYKQLERDIQLMRETGCSYHMCHVSSKESVALVRAAKAEGLDITCETAPHYLVLSKDMIEDHGRFKMNPPIKYREDREVLIEAIKDGTVDMIATDHAPHSVEEKSKGFAGSAFGIVGLETAFPVLYTELVCRGIITFDHLIDLLYTKPRERFGMEVCDIESELEKDAPAFTVWDLDTEYTIDPEKFMTKGRSTPFEGWKVKGRCLRTVFNGKVVWEGKTE